MSDTDSFINEVTEEVRRDRLFAALRKYGWIGILAVLLIVGGAAWLELNRSQDRAAAQGFGDGLLAALSVDDATARGAALADLSAAQPTGRAALDFLRSAELARLDQPAAALIIYDALAVDPALPDGWRQIAGFKAVLAGSIADTLSVDERAARLTGLVQSGGVMRLPAEEQLALIDVIRGDSTAALDRLTRIGADADATQGLRLRTSRLIVALGGRPPEVANPLAPQQ